MDSAPDRAAERRHHGLYVGLGLLLLFLLVEFLAAGVQAAPRPALSSAALRPVLPAGAAIEPALTWTNASSGAEGGPLDLTGRSPLLVAACSDGGAIAIDLGDRGTVTLDCTVPATAGPLVLPALPSGGADEIDVRATDGNPRYVVKVLATGR